MTTVESFQVVAAVGAAFGVLALMVPGLRGRSAAPRQAGGLAVVVAAWMLLVGSLVSRDDVDRLADRLDSATRIGAALVAAIALIAVSLLLVRLCLRRPTAWFVLAAVAAPIRVPVSLGGDRSGNLLIPLYWVIAIGLTAVVWGRRHGRFAGMFERNTPLDLPIAAFTAFSLVSTWWSGDINEATVKMVFFYLPFVLLYRLVIAWWDAAEHPLRAATYATLAVGVVMAVVAIGQFATRTIWWNDTLAQGNVYNRFFRANGLFYDPNILGRYLMVGLVGVAALAWLSSRRRDLVALAVIGAALAAGLAVTFSRSSALGLMVAVVMLALRSVGWKRSLIVGGAALVLIGGPAVAFNENVREKATSLEKLASSGEGRFRLAKGGVELWKTAPVAGVGLGAFSEEYRQTLPRRQQLRTRVVISHTAPVTVLAELGVVGFGLFAIACFSLLVVLWRSSRRLGGEAGWTQWAILAALVGIFVHSLLYSGLFEDPFLWMLAAAGLSLGAGSGRIASHDGTRALPVVPSTADGSDGG